MLTERQMQYLLTVAEEQNITAAARKLYLSQPALSRLLLNLEKELGTKLFIRDHGTMRLTQTGKIYLKGCREILAINKSVEREISDQTGSCGGKLLVGASALMGEFLLPRILNDFEQKYPHVELELVEAKASSLLDLVESGKVDLALSYDNDHPELNYMVLYREPLYIQVPPSFAAEYPELHPGTQNPPLRPQTLNDRPFIALRKGTGMYKVTEEFFRRFGITPSRVIETDNMHIANILVRLNRGFTLIPVIATHRFFYDEAESIYCAMSNGAIERTIYVCSRRNEYRTEAERFLLGLIANALSSQTRAE